MQFFMTVKQKAKNYQIDQFFLLFTHDYRKIEFRFLRQKFTKFKLKMKIENGIQTKKWFFFLLQILARKFKFDFAFAMIMSEK